MAHTSAPSTGVSRTHYAQLDGLRACAILPVVAYHFGLQHKDTNDPGLLLDLSHFGWMGVDLFFVLSGFLITSILVETKEGPRYFKNFLMRRFLRIWPLYYAALFTLFFAIPWMVSTTPPEIERMQEHQWWFWLYGANWLFASLGDFSNVPGGYFWSLAVEEQFYLIWPFVVYHLSERGILRLALTLLGLSLLGRAIGLYLFELTPSTLYAMTFTHLDGLVVGAALAICLRHEHLVQWLAPKVPYVFALSLAALIGIRLSGGSWVFWTPEMAFTGYTLIALMCGAVLFAVIRYGSNHQWVRLLLENKPMMETGRYSYALYLIHVPVGVALASLFHHFDLFDATYGYAIGYALFFAVALSLSWLLSWLSYHVFEKHILKLKRHFSY